MQTHKFLHRAGKCLSMGDLYDLDYIFHLCDLHEVRRDIKTMLHLNTSTAL